MDKMSLGAMMTYVILPILRLIEEERKRNIVLLPDRFVNTTCCHYVAHYARV